MNANKDGRSFDFIRCQLGRTNQLRKNAIKGEFSVD